ncbi:MAG: transcription-repair coupling factor [Bacteroides sp.]|nr:transcription-repair coupling factor [Bacteroides sp.]MCM1421703.1 transcription-repair coupling factor [Bacteroides sp.]
MRALAEIVAKDHHRRIVLDGLCASAAPLMLSALASSVRASLPLMLCVLDDMDEAGYFYHDLVQMIGGEKALFFPSTYRRAIKYNQKDAANGILRTEVLSRLADRHSMPWFVVTYPEAMAEKVVSKSELADNTLKISVGASVDICLLEKKLLELGFFRTDYVYEPGQFAIRGSIVDIYSFASEYPFRIDFFGDDVDSIRTFDVQSQLSQERVETMTVVPEMDNADVEYIPFTDFLPENSFVVAKNIGFVCDKVARIYEEGFSVQALLEEHAGQEKKKQGNNQYESSFTDVYDGTASSVERIRDHTIVCGDDFVRGISMFRRMDIGHGALAESLDSGSCTQVKFDTVAQPLFHKNFDLLTSEMRKLIGEGYKINILADSEKQIVRLKDIFTEIARTEADKALAAGASMEMIESGDVSMPYTPIRFEPVNKAIHGGFIDRALRQCFFTDHQIFDRFHKYNLKSDKARKGKVALTLKEISQFEPGDYVVHIDHGVGRFGGLVRVPSATGVMQEMIKITYQNEDTVYVSIHALHKVSKYKGREGEPPRLNKLGTGAWERMKDRVKTKVKDIARDLIRLYAQRRQEKGFAFSPDGYMQHELEASFLYEDTPDQLKATHEVKKDMERERPMDRLVCGDVGFGKTEIAVRAAFKAAADGKQVAVLVPTTVLAYQHYNTFSSRLKDFPVRVDYLSRARTAKELNGVLKDLAEGKIEIIVGTHKLIGKSVKFKDLGLLIIDEEQKFGVSVKEKLRQMKVNVDTLTMTATPIPRTLQFSLMGARDLSVIQTPPPNRYPIQTEIHTFSEEVVAEAINFELSRNGQVFFVNNKISNLPQLEAMIHRVVPDARVCVGHGRMEPKELEQVVYDFMNHDYDVMLSTTIVESGIDVPNANTIIINSAHNYGLSDLHQMRGRVGRGNKKAFCYLLAPPLASLADDSRRRLQAIENFSDLGSGLHIAMQDLDIRGAGNMLGAEQSGFIADLGYETYQKVLSEAVKELRETEFAELYAEESEVDGKPTGENFVEETIIESDLPAYFPEEYVPSSGERMSLYRELDNLSDERQLENFRLRMVDRFGVLPKAGEELLCIMPLKWVARNLGIEKITLKQGRMILFLVSDFKSKYYLSRAFEKVINYASYHPRECKLRDGDKRSLLVSGVDTVARAAQILQLIDVGK